MTSVVILPVCVYQRSYYELVQLYVFPDNCGIILVKGKRLDVS